MWNEIDGSRTRHRKKITSFLFYSGLEKKGYFVYFFQSKLVSKETQKLKTL